jgi:16S rRNA G1207 methylase RsmC
VFSHRRLDLGARTLINAMEIRPGMRVLDIGCGSGVVGFAAALRSENVSVLAVDSNARAIDCTIRGAIRNNLTNVETLLNASGECGEPRTFDLVLGNPPYFSNYRIAEIFLEAARRALKPGGEVLMVTKTPNWFLEHMPRYFQHVEERPAKNYSSVAGRQK